MPGVAHRTLGSNMYVCICNAVTDKQIHQAVREGARTTRALQERLKVSTRCGCCAPSVEEQLRLALADCAAHSMKPSGTLATVGAGEPS